MRTEILPYQKLASLGFNLGKTKVKKFLQLNLTKNNIILISAAFLLGRASMLNGLMPFGIAAYASTIGLNVNRLMAAIFVILGMLSGGARGQIYVCLSAMLIFNAINMVVKGSKANMNFKYSVIAFISVMIPEMVLVYLQGFLLFDLLKALMHGFIVFSLMFIFRNAVPAIAEGQTKASYSNEELISMAIITALAVSGLSNISIAGFEIKNIISIFLILVFSYRCGHGVGAAVGVVIGLIASMSANAPPIVIGSYAFCGLLAGVFRSIGKIGSGLGFVLGNSVLTLYLNGSIDVLIYLKEILVALLLFIAVPKKIMDLASRIVGADAEKEVDKQSYGSRIKELTVEKLNKFSRTFKELSKTFGEIADTKVTAEKQDISSMLDRVADKICKDCSLCLHCWDRNFYDTYQVMFKIVEKLDIKGRIDESDIPDYFLGRCERVVDFVKAINNAYEVFKVHMVWKGRVGESRALVSQQFEGLSNVISNLASEIDMEVHFKAELEDIILNELKKEGVKASDVIVFENKWGKYEISVFHKGCGGKRQCIKTIERAVSHSVGRKMIKEDKDCCQKLKNNLCTLKLAEEEVFKVTTGVAKLAKYGGMISGDSYTFMNTGKGKYIAAISDGMGSGQRAATQSRATISLLEQFMESGFDKETTVKFINSILVLKSGEDSFTTIDMSVIDLYEGEAEFIKIGAAPTYIKKQERVDTVKSVSLPAGILEDVEIELVHKRIDNGDFIIMLSDGIFDSFNINEGGDKELEDLICEIKSMNPQEIADAILDRAYINCEEKPVDDMMVVVAKLWKAGNV